MAPKRPALGLALLASAGALDDGLARSPPMGWRSWNLYGEHVDQPLMQSIMDAMVARRRTVDGIPTSLCDLGYCNVGLDDNWQACGNGTNMYRYHAAGPNGTFHPVVNEARFPDLAAMTAHGHRLGLSVGWYGNNCICREYWPAGEALYKGDVDALVAYGFDSIKLDGCGSEWELDTWSRLINETKRPVTIENCHWGLSTPEGDWCPFHIFRTSGDVRASYGSIISNLLSTVYWAEKKISRPGCWAYPDGLEVGCAHGPGGPHDPGLTPQEARSHFGAWCIVSSPLVLSMDLHNDTLMDEVWPLVANKEAIAVNQAWAGHSGSPFLQAGGEVLLKDFQTAADGAKSALAASVPSWQYFYKPLGGGKTAILLMNHDSVRQFLKLPFSLVPGVACLPCHVRDVWRHQDLGAMEEISAEVDSHDSVFLVLSSTVELLV